MNPNFKVLSGIDFSSNFKTIKTMYDSNTATCLDECDKTNNCDVVKVFGGPGKEENQCKLIDASGVISCENDPDGDESKFYVKNNIEGLDTCIDNPFVKNLSTPNVNEFNMFTNKEYVNDQYYLPASKINHHTRFSLQDIDVKMPIANWGKSVKCRIPFHGDLLNSVIVEIKLPKMTVPGVYWRRFTGNYLLRRAQLIIDNIQIAEHYQLTAIIENGQDFKKPNFEKMITPPLYDPDQPVKEHTLYMRLNFWFCKDYFNSIPLLSLTNRQVEISIDLADINFLLLTTLDSEYSPMQVQKSEQTKLNIAQYSDTHKPELTLLCKYIFLESIERSKFINSRLIYNVTYSIDKFFSNVNNLDVPLPVESYLKEIQFIFVNSFGYTYNPLNSIYITDISDFDATTIYHISNDTITSDVDWINNKYVVSDNAIYHTPDFMSTKTTGFFKFDRSTKDSQNNHIIVTLKSINLLTTLDVTVNNFLINSQPFFHVNQNTPILRLLHIRKKNSQFEFTKDIDIVSGVSGLNKNPTYFNLIENNSTTLTELNSNGVLDIQGKYFYIIHIYGSLPGSLVAIKPVPSIAQNKIDTIDKDKIYENTIFIANIKAPVPDIQIQLNSPYATIGPLSLKEIIVHDLYDERSLNSRDYKHHTYRRKYARTSNFRNTTLLFSDSNQPHIPYVFEQNNTTNPNDLTDYIYPSVRPFSHKRPNINNPANNRTHSKVQKQRTSTSIMNTELAQLPIFRLKFSLNPTSSQPSGHIIANDKWTISCTDTQDNTSTFNLLLVLLIQDTLIVQNNTLYFNKFKF
tara:strand:+ start:2918 stop:5314 length:2397 start_codon:yes stop_codon:yes gene_type:complete